MSAILGRFSEYLSIGGEQSEGEENDSEGSDERQSAIKTYMQQGGIIKVDKSGRKPRLVYPGADRIRKQLEETKRKEEYMRKQLNSLRRKQRDVANKAVGSVKKVFNPVYWQHQYKKRRDDDYRSVYEEIDPPMEKLDDPKYRPMLEMFVKEPEYRERLLEAARSEIGRGRDTIRQQVIKREGFTKEVIDNRIKKIEKEIEKYRDKKSALKVLLKWVKE